MRMDSRTGKVRKYAPIPQLDKRSSERGEHYVGMVGRRCDKFRVNADFFVNLEVTGNDFRGVNPARCVSVRKPGLGLSKFNVQHVYKQL